jgi:SIR2-like domain
MPNKPNRNHNVYILGAGFSYDAGLPLINNFLQKMASTRDTLEQNGSTTDVQVIEKVFEFRHRAKGVCEETTLNPENIEDLFSLASASVDDEINKYVRKSIALTLNESSKENPLNKIIFVINKNGVNSETIQMSNYYDYYSQVIHGKYLNNCEQKNTVITFNYDTLLEEALKRSKLEFTYGFEVGDMEYVNCNNTENCLQILKLHGSLNWSDKNKIYENYDLLSKSDEDVLIIPPTWNKVFNEIFLKVWKNAVNALTDATRIIIIGFSVPPTDVHFKFLIAAGLQNNISLRKFIFVNPSLKNNVEAKKLKDNIFKVLRKRLVEQGKIEFVDKTTNEYLTDPEVLRKIQRLDSNTGFTFT